MNGVFSQFPDLFNNIFGQNGIFQNMTNMTMNNQNPNGGNGVPPNFNPNAQQFNNQNQQAYNQGGNPNAGNQQQTPPNYSSSNDGSNMSPFNNKM